MFAFLGWGKEKGRAGLWQVTLQAAIAELLWQQLVQREGERGRAVRVYMYTYRPYALLLVCCSVRCASEAERGNKYLLCLELAVCLPVLSTCLSTLQCLSGLDPLVCCCELPALPAKPSACTAADGAKAAARRSPHKRLHCCKCPLCPSCHCFFCCASHLLPPAADVPVYCPHLVP